MHETWVIDGGGTGRQFCRRPTGRALSLSVGWELRTRAKLWWSSLTFLFTRAIQGDKHEESGFMTSLGVAM